MPYKQTTREFRNATEVIQSFKGGGTPLERVQRGVSFIEKIASKGWKRQFFRRKNGKTVVVDIHVNFDDKSPISWAFRDRKDLRNSHGYVPESVVFLVILGREPTLRELCPLGLAGIDPQDENALNRAWKNYMLLWRKERISG